MGDKMTIQEWKYPSGSFKWTNSDAAIPMSLDLDRALVKSGHLQQIVLTPKAVGGMPGRIHLEYNRVEADGTVVSDNAYI